MAPELRLHGLTAFGGAGPMHANALAKELDIPRILVPTSPGLFSALGLLVTDLKHDYVQTYITDLAKMYRKKAESIYVKFEEQARLMLFKEGIQEEQITINRFVDMRYVGQSYELTIQVPGTTTISDRVLSSVRERFHREHERAYGHSAPKEPVEVVNLRLTAVGVIAKPRLVEVRHGGRDPRDALSKAREVFFTRSGLESCNVYNRYKLRKGNIVTGPAVVEEIDSTTIIYPGYKTEVKRWGFLVIDKDD